MVDVLPSATHSLAGVLILSEHKSLVLPHDFTEQNLPNIFQLSSLLPSDWLPSGCF